MLAGAGGLLAVPAIVHAQGQGQGVALVIGNSKYHWEPQLPNVKRDVPDIAQRFQALGLKTELLQDLGRDALDAAIKKFAAAARGAKFSAFFFAGHGVSWQRRNHIVPIDADLSSESGTRSLFSAAVPIDAAKGANAFMVVLDNCYNSPFDGWRQREARLAAAQNPSLASRVLGVRNGLAVISTAPGCPAFDGPAGQNSPFASAFMRLISQPAVDLQALPARLRRDVLVATEGRQLTYEASSFDSPFILSSTGKPFAGSSGAGGDPSRIVELGNAYEYARKNDLYLPPGLIAYRSPPGSPNAHMVGAYKIELLQSANANATASMMTPAIYIVLSTPQPDTLEFIMASKNFTNNSDGKYWRYATLTQTRNGFTYFDGGQHDLRWNDRNSGTASIEVPGSRMPRSFPFTRIDG